jgi:hypothetical protein
VKQVATLVYLLGLFYPEDGGDMFLRNVSSNPTYGITFYNVLKEVLLNPVFALTMLNVRGSLKTETRSELVMQLYVLRAHK